MKKQERAKEITINRGTGVSTWKLAVIVLAVIAVSVVGGLTLSGPQKKRSPHQSGVELGFDAPSHEATAG